MIFEYTDLKPRNPHFSLAMEEAFCYFLSHQSPSGFKGGLRLWANPRSVILGRTCKSEENLLFDDQYNTANPDPQNHDVPVCRRLSGGGTVLHGPGNINYSIYLNLTVWPDLYNVTHSYKTLLELVRHALQIQELDCEWRGLSDLVLINQDKDYKISGNSQFRKYGILCLHGTLITSSELIDNINAQLKHPPKEPAYRAGRKHTSFLGSLPASFEVAQFFLNLKQQLQLLTRVNNLKQLDRKDRLHIYSKTKNLTRNVYTNPDWIFKGMGVAGRKGTHLDKLKRPFIHTVNQQVPHPNTIQQV